MNQKWNELRDWNWCGLGWKLFEGSMWSEFAFFFFSFALFLSISWQHSERMKWIVSQISRTFLPTVTSQPLLWSPFIQAEDLGGATCQIFAYLELIRGINVVASIASMPHDPGVFRHLYKKCIYCPRWKQSCLVQRSIPRTEELQDYM